MVKSAQDINCLDVLNSKKLLLSKKLTLTRYSKSAIIEADNRYRWLPGELKSPYQKRMAVESMKYHWALVKNHSSSEEQDE